MPDATVHAQARILERIETVLYHVSLPNGKRILAHLSKPLAESQASFEIGCDVIVEMTAYDFEQARILRLADS